MGRSPAGSPITVRACAPGSAGASVVRRRPRIWRKRCACVWRRAPAPEEKSTCAGLPTGSRTRSSSTTTAARRSGQGSRSTPRTSALPPLGRSRCWPADKPSRACGRRSCRSSLDPEHRLPYCLYLSLALPEATGSLVSRHSSGALDCFAGFYLTLPPRRTKRASSAVKYEERHFGRECRVPEHRDVMPTLPSVALDPRQSLAGMTATAVGCVPRTDDGAHSACSLSTSGQWIPCAAPMISKC